MTPAAWIEPRAREWAEWVDKCKAGAVGHAASCSLAEVVGENNYWSGNDFTFFDLQACERFDAAVGGLADPLRVIFRIHWLGSDAHRMWHGSPVAEKAGRCGVSRATYYRRIDEANLLLYRELN